MLSKKGRFTKKLNNVKLEAEINLLNLNDLKNYVYRGKLGRNRKSKNKINNIVRYKLTLRL